MSERDADFVPGSESPPVPDASGSTAEFRAFANRISEAEQPWTMKAPGKRVLMLVGIVLLVALVLALIAIAVAG